VSTPQESQLQQRQQEQHKPLEEELQDIEQQAREGRHDVVRGKEGTYQLAAGRRRDMSSTREKYHQQQDETNRTVEGLID